MWGWGARVWRVWRVVCVCAGGKSACDHWGIHHRLRRRGPSWGQTSIGGVRAHVSPQGTSSVQPTAGVARQVGSTQPDGFGWLGGGGGGHTAVRGTHGFRAGASKARACRHGRRWLREFAVVKATRRHVGGKNQMDAPVTMFMPCLFVCAGVPAPRTTTSAGTGHSHELPFVLSRLGFSSNM